jgi:rod shape-determining protein MreC
MILFGVGKTPFVQSIMRGGDDAATSIGQATQDPRARTQTNPNLFARLVEMWTAVDRVQELEAQNRDLQVWKGLAERLAERNQRYEALLRMPADAFGDGADIQHAIAAQLVLQPGGPFTRTLVANAGFDEGVRVGYIAVNENGLVGRVISIGHHSARILMLDDYNSRIPVMGEASRVRAVLAGQATDPPELLTGPYSVQTPRLDFIVGAQSLREGERIMTSGDGGLYPRGVPIGVARRGGDGAWRVVLAVSQSPIDFVRLIRYVGAQAPEEGPVADAGPPSSARSSVAAIERTTMTPLATAPSRPAAAHLTPAATTTTGSGVAPAAATTAPGAPPANPAPNPRANGPGPNPGANPAPPTNR